MNVKIVEFLESKGIPPRQRIERSGGGQYLSHLLLEFGILIQDETIIKVQEGLKEIKKSQQK